MSEPKRLLDEPGELAPAERRALEAALGDRPPPAAKRAVLGAVLALGVIPRLSLNVGRATCGLTTDERKRLKELKRENLELEE